MFMKGYLRVNKNNKKIGNLKVQYYNNDRTYSYSNINCNQIETIEVKFWNKTKRKVRANHPRSVELNNMIESKISELKDKKDLTNNQSKEKNSFIEYYRESLKKELKLGTSPDTIKSYKSSLKKLLSLLDEQGKSDLKFDEIDLNFLREFEEHISSDLSYTTQNKYIKHQKTIYRRAQREYIYSPKRDPYLNYKIPNGTSLKPFLSSSHISDLSSERLNKGSQLEITRNRFLCQFHLQGIRVSDLMTIRYNQMFFDENNMNILQIIQYKTRDPLTIILTEDSVRYLFYFLDIDEYYKMYHETKIKDMMNLDYDITIEGLESIYYVMSEDKQRDLKGYDKIKNDLDFAYKNLMVKQLELFKIKQKEHPNHFILDFLDNKLYEDVVFNEKRSLSKKQRSRLQSKQVPYNKNLKELDDILKSNINITSHISRHSYAHNCLMNDMDYLVIQELLGHKNISTTQNYLRGIDKKFLHKKVRENIEKNKHRIRDHNPNY